MSVVTTIERGSEEAIKRMYDEVSDVALPFGLRFPSDPKIVIISYSKESRGFKESYISGLGGNFIYLPERKLNTRELYTVLAHVGGHFFQNTSNPAITNDAKFLSEGWATRVEDRLAKPLGISNWGLLYQALKDAVELGDRSCIPYVKGREAFVSIGQRDGWNREIEVALRCSNDEELFRIVGQPIKQ